VIGLASITTAILGSLLADVAPQRVLRVGFALILIWTALRIVQGVRRRAVHAPAIDSTRVGD
jgi:uncharacterized membrane protein YfcA